MAGRFRLTAPFQRSKRPRQPRSPRPCLRTRGELAVVFCDELWVHRPGHSVRRGRHPPKPVLQRRAQDRDSCLWPARGPLSHHSRHLPPAVDKFRRDGRAHRWRRPHSHGLVRGHAHRSIRWTGRCTQRLPNLLGCHGGHHFSLVLVLHNRPRACVGHGRGTGGAGFHVGRIGLAAYHRRHADFGGWQPRSISRAGGGPAPSNSAMPVRYPVRGPSNFGPIWESAAKRGATFRVGKTVRAEPLDQHIDHRRIRCGRSHPSSRTSPAPGATCSPPGSARPRRWMHPAR